MSNITQIVRGIQHYEDEAGESRQTPAYQVELNNGSTAVIIEAQNNALHQEISRHMRAIERALNTIQPTETIDFSEEILQDVIEAS